MGKRTNRTYLYTNLLKWEPLEVKGSEGRAWIKTLAFDPDNGARTALIKFEPGYRQAATVSTWPEDIYTLEGEMQCGERQYQKDTYHYRPAGTPFGPVTSPKGVTRIVMTADDRSLASKQEVFVEDVNQIPWGRSYVEPTVKRTGIKVLRQDKEANISILLHRTFINGGRIFVNQGHMHNHIEEVLVLEGEGEEYHADIQGHAEWVPGLYVCREPNRGPHGDNMWTKVPAVTLIRRGWAGDMTKFWDAAGHTVVVPFSPVDFEE